MLARIAPDVIASDHAIYGLGWLLAAVTLVAAIAVGVLGVPAVLFLRRLHRLNWQSVSLAGLLLGALPFASGWPQRTEGYSAGHNWHGTYAETYVNGLPTQFAWWNYAETVAFGALHGLTGALSFLAVYRWLERRQPSATLPLR